MSLLPTFWNFWRLGFTLQLFPLRGHLKEWGIKDHPEQFLWNRLLVLGPIEVCWWSKGAAARAAEEER